MTIRSERDMTRGRLAAAEAQAAGTSAFESALIHIHSTCSRVYTEHSMFKDRVESMMVRGASHPAVYLRYAIIADAYPGVTLDTAIEIVACELRAEHDRREMAYRTIRHRGARVTLETLRELNLILRMLRRYAPAAFVPAREAVLARGTADATLMIAAE